MSDVEIRGPGDEVGWPSVEDAVPTDSGGPDARRGFDFQDEVAVGILIEMMEDPSILRIQCETHDDTVILRDLGNELLNACYVQVKGSQRAKHLSFADLCQREGGAPGSSLFEYSLGKDRHAEAGTFRIFTVRPLTDDLELLTYELSSAHRLPGDQAYEKLVKSLDDRFEGLLSPKGNGAGYWVSNCSWSAGLDEGGMCLKNTVNLLKLSKQLGFSIVIDHAELLLCELRRMVKEASAFKWVPDKAKKIFHREKVLTWLVQKLDEIRHGSSAPAGGKLRGKMNAVVLPEDVIGLALELRRHYSEVSRTQKYQSDEGQAELRRRVEAEIITLRAKHTAGLLECTPSQFHALCLAKMDEINQSRPGNLTDQSAYLKGCMYDIADRCLLKFEGA